MARLIDGIRVDAACQVLQSVQSVTEAMRVSGLNPKSNFNRAFRLATGTSAVPNGAACPP